MFDKIPQELPQSVGRETVRVDVSDKVTGEARYTGDFLLPGMLHANVKRSPHARAKILSIDVKNATRLPGVHAVLTGRELPYRLGLYLVDKHILARDFVRHYGEAVACPGCCSIAPVVKIGEEIVGNVEAKDVKKLLKNRGHGGKQ